jgi:hypothetical protein
MGKTSITADASSPSGHPRSGGLLLALVVFMPQLDNAHFLVYNMCVICARVKPDKEVRPAI